jgi:hypothetical protein
MNISISRTNSNMKIVYQIQYNKIPIYIIKQIITILDYRKYFKTLYVSNKLEVRLV